MAKADSTAKNAPVDVEMTRHAPSNIRSVRVPDEAWTAAKERAQAEGVAMSYVVAQLVEGYSIGAFNMPRLVKQFDRATK